MKSLPVLTAAAILAASAGIASADSRVFFAYLYGGHERPAAGDANAYGMATVTLTTATSLCYSIVLQNAGAANAAHIHTGAAGVAGPPTITLPVNASVPARVAGCVVGILAATITNIRNDPQNFYVNVHNAAFPNGAARGQLQ